jgi:hypothetical protein
MIKITAKSPIAHKEKMRNVKLSKHKRQITTLKFEELNSGQHMGRSVIRPQTQNLG